MEFIFKHKKRAIKERKFTDIVSLERPEYSDWKFELKDGQRIELSKDWRLIKICQ